MSDEQANALDAAGVSPRLKVKANGKLSSGLRSILKHLAAGPGMATTAVLSLIRRTPYAS